MKKIIKRMQALLMGCILFCYPTANAYANELSNEVAEAPIESYNIDELSDDEFDMDSVIVILKKEYSSPDSKINKNIFKCVESKNEKNLSESDGNNSDQFRNIIHVELKKKRTGRS